MPRASGANPGLALRGFTHTTRCATRCNRCTCSASTSGSPRSQPSERITTTAPRARPRSPHRSLKVRTPSPSRVPPDQSSTAPATASRAASGSRDPSSRVMRVQRVPSVNTSTCARPTTATCANRTKARAYASIEPDTSHSSTTRRGRSPVRRWTVRSGSPPVRSARRVVAPTSIGPRCRLVGRWRRDARRAPTRRRSPISRCASSSSSTLQRAKSFDRRSSRSVQRNAKDSPSTGSGSAPSTAGGVLVGVQEQGDGLRLGARRLVIAPGAPFEDARKGAVVGGDVLGTAHQRGATGPVRRRATLHADLGERGGVGQGGVRAAPRRRARAACGPW